MVHEKKTLEEMLGEVEEVLEQLRQRELSLEDSFVLYQKGIEELARCKEEMDQIEKKLIILEEGLPTETE